MPIPSATDTKAVNSMLVIKKVEEKKAPAIAVPKKSALKKETKPKPKSWLSIFTWNRNPQVTFNEKAEVAYFSKDILESRFVKDFRR